MARNCANNRLNLTYRWTFLKTNHDVLCKSAMDGKLNIVWHDYMCF